MAFRSADTGTYNRNDGSKSSGYVWYEGGAVPLQRNLFQVGTRFVWNPAGDLRIIGNVYGGRLGATTGAYAAAGTDEFVNFVAGDLAVRYKKWMVKGDLSVNAWGEEEWWRNFNQTFPLQYGLDVAYGFSKPIFAEATNRIGMNIKGAVFGEHSSDAYNALPKGIKMDGANYMELSVYCNLGL